MLLPFGLDSQLFTETLEEQIRSAIPSDLSPKRVWITVGSGTLLRVLAKIWKNTIFMPVIVGKKMWEDQYEPEVWERLGGSERINQLAAPQRFVERVPSNLMPPYPSISTYDAKLWQRVLEYGQEGDYIWNVGRDL